MHLKKLFYLCLLYALPAFAAIEVQGHRGARGSRPENTLPAFQFAIDQHIDTLELDIAVSKDNELVISHDPAITPDRCLGPDGKNLEHDFVIHEMTYAQISKFDCGSIKNPKFPDQVLLPHTPKPRLEDLFVMVETNKNPWGKNVQFNIETKIFPAHPELTPEPQVFSQMIIELGRKHKMIERMILQSFDDRTLLAAKALEPRLRTSLLTSDNHVNYVAVMRAAKADILSPQYDWILESDVKALHAEHFKVLPWTINKKEEWDRMIALGVDGIISDYPVELSKFLKDKGLR